MPPSDGIVESFGGSIEVDSVVGKKDVAGGAFTPAATDFVGWVSNTVLENPYNLHAIKAALAVHLRHSTATPSNLLEADLVILDEASMIDAVFAYESATPGATGPRSSRARSRSRAACAHCGDRLRVLAV